jgi:septum formation topological specificity factor MinE
LSNDAQVTISVFDMLGREIMTPVNKYTENGVHQLILKKSDLGNSGIYFINIKVDNNSKTCKVVFR